MLEDWRPALCVLFFLIALLASWITYPEGRRLWIVIGFFLFFALLFALS